MRYFGIIFLLFLFPALLKAQNDIKVSASVSENQVFNGERLNFSIEIEGNNFRNLGRPAFPSQLQGFRILSLQPSTSENYSMINGVVSRSYTYTYSLLAETPGRYSLPAISVEVNGQTYTTQPVQVTVIDRNTSAGRTGAQQPDVFIKIEVSDARPVVGQQIIADLVLYFKSPLEIVSYQPSSNWITEGFWKEILSDGSNPRAESVIIGGERFRRAVLLRHALFPSRAGNLTIGQAKVNTTVRNTSRYSDPFSSFFGGFGSNQRTVELTSEAISITVRPLPATSEMTINAVGNFNISRRLSPSTAMVGEAVEVITEITGTGNLALVSKPVYEFPEEFEVFQPQEQLNITKESGQISGTRTFRDIVIVRRPGDYTIPERTIAYYNPELRRYQTSRLSALNLRVNRDENAAFTLTQQRELLIQPVTGVVTWANGRNSHILASWWLWVGLLLPVGFTYLAWTRKKEMDRLKNDLGYARRVMALQKAEESLQSVEKRVSGSKPDVKTCMSLLHSVIYNFVADKTGASAASFNDQKVLEIVTQANLSEEALKDLQRMLTKCSTIRFAPVIGRENLTYEIDKTREIVQKINEVL